MSFLAIMAVAALLVAATQDLRCRLIPDTAAIAIAASGAIACALSGDPLSTITIVVALFGCGAVLFHLGVMGGGDVKLIAAMGFWLSPWTVAPFLLVMAMAGGVLALGTIVYVTMSHRDATAVVPTVPYGVAIAISGMFILAGAY
jgi:prepilin peptidase CpaA